MKAVCRSSARTCSLTSRPGFRTPRTIVHVPIRHMAEPPKEEGFKQRTTEYVDLDQMNLTQNDAWKHAQLHDPRTIEGWVTADKEIHHILNSIMQLSGKEIFALEEMTVQRTGVPREVWEKQHQQAKDVLADQMGVPHMKAFSLIPEVSYAPSPSPPSPPTPSQEKQKTKK
eukprot:TRINITY_DN3191_c0_g1_i1.p1 TRINITY_DN3191_c0_g1~~TRINITY_DN3191_c0_g1_i1.p1  ORF type:complete len:171 (-),score=35.99 TRINITY_DN3191_c0_g1_i1:61-573(-)